MITHFSPIPEGFFGESGLTATSANHIANLLKFRYDRLEREIGQLNYVTEKLTIVGSETEHTMKEAFVIDDVTIREKLDEIARCKGFIAFLREAIKCKNALALEIEEYASLPIEQPQPPIAERPLTEAQVIEKMSIGDRVRYLAAEARAATYGKYIHPDGFLEHARQRAYDAATEPTKVALNGRDTAFVKRLCEVSPFNIDKMILALQAEHRKSEAELNGYKHEIEEAAKKDAQTKLDEYRAREDEYNRLCDERRKAVEAQNIADQQARIDRRKVIEGLKIIIPNEYRDLYNAVNG